MTVMDSDVPTGMDVRNLCVMVVMEQAVKNVKYVVVVGTVARFINNFNDKKYKITEKPTVIENMENLSFSV
jgi:hypothetical protein